MIFFIRTSFLLYNRQSLVFVVQKTAIEYIFRISYCYGVTTIVGIPSLLVYPPWVSAPFPSNDGTNAIEGPVMNLIAQKQEPPHISNNGIIL